MISAIPIKPYKQHQLEDGTEVEQWGYEGIALSPPEQAVILKVNELIVMANDLLEMKEIVGTVVTKSGCCTEEDEHD